MSTCHLIPDLDLTLLSDIDLSHLDDTGRKFVTHRFVELLTTKIGLVFLRLLQVVGDDFGDELIGMFVARPAREDDLVIVQRLEFCARELRPLTDLLDPKEVLHAVLTGLAGGELMKLVEEELTKFSLLALSLLFERSNRILQFGTILLRCLRVELGIDNNPTERRRSLE